MTDDRPVLGIDLGGTNMQIGVVGPDHQILGRVKRKTEASQGHDAIINRMAAGADEACAKASVARTDLAGLGIGAPGAIDYEHGVILEAPNLGWDDFPLVERLERAMGLCVSMDNDVNVAVLGEHRLGAGRGVSNLMGVWIGTGIGGGLIVNGSLYHGGLGTAGEIGQTILFPDAAPESRTLEQNCSRKQVVERLRGLVEAGHSSILRELADDASEIEVELVAKAYHAGDELTTGVINEVAQYIGATIASVVTLLSIPKVILGGGLTEVLDMPFIERVKESMDQHVFPGKLRAVEVVPTQLRDDAGLLGAALLAQDRLAAQGAGVHPHSL